MGPGMVIAGLVGWAAFGPFGALVGAWLGHQIDRGSAGSAVTGSSAVERAPSPWQSLSATSSDLPRSRRFTTPRGVVLDEYGQIVQGPPERR